MDLGDDERAFLTANRAILIDHGGVEIFIGLTADESEEYLRLSRANESGRLATTDNPRFTALHDRHEAERQVYARGEKSLHPFQKP